MTSATSLLHKKRKLFLLGFKKKCFTGGPIKDATTTAAPTSADPTTPAPSANYTTVAPTTIALTTRRVTFRSLLNTFTSDFLDLSSAAFRNRASMIKGQVSLTLRIKP